MNNLDKRKYRQITMFVIILSLMLLVAVFSIALGSVKIHPLDVLRILTGKVSSDHPFYKIVWITRLPRAVSSLIGGAAIAVSGLLLQVFFRNPIVDSYVLGISSGSTFFVALVMLGGVTFGFSTMSPYFIFLGAFIGACVVMLIVMGFAYKVKQVVTLLIIGMMIGYLCSAASGLLLTFADHDKVKGFTMWTLGSFAGMTFKELTILSVIAVPVIIVVFFLSKSLNAFLLGENYAKSMGVNIKQFRLFIILSSSLLTAAVTAFTGPIAFIGLSVPHITRLIFKSSDNRLLLPATVVVGATMTAFCDLIARSLFAPVELAVSSVTSFFGVPIVIYLLLKRKTEL